MTWWLYAPKRIRFQAEKLNQHRVVLKFAFYMTFDAAMSQRVLHNNYNISENLTYIWITKI